MINRKKQLPGSLVKDWLNKEKVSRGPEIDFMEYSTDALIQAAYVPSAYTADLCTGGTVYSSGDHESYPRTGAFDNDTSTLWSSDSRGGAYNTLIAYKFAEAKRIQRVKIIGRVGSPELNFKNFKIQGSNNSTNGIDGDWTDLSTGLNTSASIQWDTFDFNNTTSYSFIRLIGLAQYIAGVYYIQVAEIEMMEVSFQSYSESTTKNQGTYSLKALANQTVSLNGTLTKTFSPTKDLSGVDTLKFDMRASRTGSNIKIGIHDSGGTTTETTPNITVADTWGGVEWDISAVADADKDVIDSLIITVTNADADNTFYIDNFFAEYDE